MAIRICVGIRFPILSSMINYWAQSNIRVKIFACQNLHESSLLISGCLHRFPALCRDLEERLWPFVFAMGFIIHQRRSQHIINIYRTIESKVMAIWICVGIRFPLLSSMIYYGCQSNIWVKTFACRNSPESSLLISGCLHRFPPYAEIQRKGYGRLYLWWDSFFNYDGLKISWTSIGQPSQKLWLSEFASAFNFHFWAPWYIIGLNRTF